jgi:hypothetical protein
MPSTTARAGGIFMPIINSLSLSAGSKPNDPSRKKLGAFLVQSQLQGSVNSSAMFLTAAAQNLLCMKLAAEMGVAVPNAWVTWVKVGRCAWQRCAGRWEGLCLAALCGRCAWRGCAWKRCAGRCAGRGCAVV